MAKYQGTGKVTEADFKAVKYVGQTKGGNPITIEFSSAINMGNINWAFAEKDDVVDEIVFTATYDNTNSMATSTDEPWTVDVVGSDEGANEIMLGVGIFSVDGTDIALTRGGGRFTVEREFREINADGDRGPVKGRVTMDASRATLAFNALTILSRVADLYPGLKTLV